MKVWVIIVIVVLGVAIVLGLLGFAAHRYRAQVFCGKQKFASWLPRPYHSMETVSPTCMHGSLFLVPHASPTFSGRTSREAYGHLGSPKGVILLLPFHYGHGVFLPSFDRFEFEGDTFNLDSRWKEFIRDGLGSIPDLPKPEHSFEMQLPFLNPSTLLCPIFLSDQERAAEVGRVVSSFASLSSYPLIVSSDLTHYGPDFSYFLDTPKPLAYCLVRDKKFIQDFPTNPKYSNSYCGCAPMKASQEAKFWIDLPKRHHAIGHSLEGSNSKGNPDPKTSFVIYPALVVGHDWKAFARETLVCLLKLERHPPTHNPKRSTLNHLFISLTTQGKTRACIGDFSSSTLEDQISSCIGGCVNDAKQRWKRPLLEKDLDSLDIHLEVLPPRSTWPKVDPDFHDLVKGRDGLEIRSGKNSALYLPHVWTESNMTLTELTASLREKAKIQKTSPASFFRFTTQSLN